MLLSAGANPAGAVSLAQRTGRTELLALLQRTAAEGQRAEELERARSEADLQAEQRRRQALEEEQARRRAEAEATERLERGYRDQRRDKDAAAERSSRNKQVMLERERLRIQEQIEERKRLLAEKTRAEEDEGMAPVRDQDRAGARAGARNTLAGWFFGLF